MWFGRAKPPYSHLLPLSLLCYLCHQLRKHYLALHRPFLQPLHGPHDQLTKYLNPLAQIFLPHGAPWLPKDMLHQLFLKILLQQLHELQVKLRGQKIQPFYPLELHLFHLQRLRHVFLRLQLHVYYEQSACEHKPGHHKDLMLFQRQLQLDQHLRNSHEVLQVILACLIYLLC